MSVPALSLLGFMEQQQAFAYLQARCDLEPASGARLYERWHDARGRLGAPVLEAGRPDIHDLPEQFQTYLDEVQSTARFGEAVRGAPWSFKLVEVAPLLSFQFHVELPRIEWLADRAAQEAPLDAALRLCLPLTSEPLPCAVQRQGDQLWIRGDRNLRLLGATVVHEDATQLDVVRIAFGAGTPFVTVVRIGGRCYLRNGYHRVCALQNMGATHVPCLLLEAGDYSQVGIDALGGGTTFGRSLLESGNPPTCGHFAADRAYPVRLRSAVRVIHVAWSEHAFAAD